MSNMSFFQIQGRVGLNWSLEATFANYTSFLPITIFFKVQVHSTRLEFESALEKDHIWMWCFHKYYVLIFEWYVVWCGSKTGHKNDMWLEETTN